MRKLTLSLLAAGVLLASQEASLELRGFYIDRYYMSATPDISASTVGGIARYQSPTWEGLSGSVGYYGSYLIPFTTAEEATKTGLLNSTSGGNLGFLGELKVGYELSKTQLTLGRQRLNTPLANDHDLRLLQSSYQAAVLRSKEIENLALELGYIHSYSGFGSKYGDYSQELSAWGASGIGYAYATYQQSKALGARIQIAQNIETASLAVTKPTTYGYGDAKWVIDEESKGFVEVQGGGNVYKNNNHALMLGLSGGMEIGAVSVMGLCNTIMGNSFKAIESGVMYSDWQQGYDKYEPSIAVGAHATLKAMDNLSIKLGAVKVASTQSVKYDDYVEYLADVNYAFSKESKMRLRYSLRDQSTISQNEDRGDFRVIYYHTLSTIF